MRDWKMLTSLSAGILTVVLWGSLPVIKHLASLPPMLITAVAMACAAGFTRLIGMVKTTKRLGRERFGVRHWTMGVGGLVGALYCYFLALEGGDPAKITLITYTWPLGLVLLSDHLDGKGVRPMTLIGASVAFAGMVPLILGDSQGTATSLWAYFAGALAGLSWIAFSLHLRQSGGLSSRGYQRLFLHAGMIALAIHLVFESTPTATTSLDWLAACLIGIGPYGLAFITWGHALKNGPTTLLGVMTYLVPIISAMLLVALGWSTLSQELFIATAAVVGGALLTQSHWPGTNGRPRGRQEAKQ